MSQDRESGAAANAWGRRTAISVAEHLGATNLSSGSNECVLNGERVVIKCAAARTSSVGVTFKMLERLDAIIGAFQLEDGAFELWSLSPSVFESEMTDTRSLGASAGKVGIVRKDVFRERGSPIGIVQLGLQ